MWHHIITWLPVNRLTHCSCLSLVELGGASLIGGRAWRRGSPGRVERTDKIDSLVISREKTHGVVSSPSNCPDATLKMLQLSAPGSTLIEDYRLLIHWTPLLVCLPCVSTLCVYLVCLPCVSTYCLPDIITRQDCPGLTPLCLYATIIRGRQLFLSLPYQLSVACSSV